MDGCARLSAQPRVVIAASRVILPDLFGIRNKNSIALEEWSRQRHLGAKYREACTCNGTDCFGQFEILVPCSGCCTDPTGCGQINNYQENTSKAAEGDQVEDETLWSGLLR